MNLSPIPFSISTYVSLNNVYILPTPLYVLTSTLSELISSMVSCNILRSRSFAWICVFAMFRFRWDWTAVCWICTRIYFAN